MKNAISLLVAAVVIGLACPASAQPAEASQIWIVNASGGIFSWTGSNWRQMPGLAKDVGVGANGSVWVVGTDAVPGGYGIYQWNGSAWVKRPGGAVRIDVDPQGTPWVVSSLGNVFRWEGNAWRVMPGLARDIGIGGDGSVWIVGTDKVPGGYGIYRWSGSNWSRVDGGAVRIDVGPAGLPWVVNESGQIYHRQGAGWKLLAGRARDIGVGAAGSWVIGTNPVPGGYGIFRWIGAAWAAVPGGAVEISVGR